MDGRGLGGAFLLAVGIVLIVVSAMQLTGASGDATAATGSPTATGSTPPASPERTTGPAASATPAPTPPPSTAPTPVLNASPDPEAMVRTFYAALVPALRTGNVETFVPLLHPATIVRYGEAACRAQLAGQADPTFDVDVISVSTPGGWDYVTDERSTQIDDAWTITADVTQAGTTSRRELHLAPIDGRVRWFSDCGTPVD